MTKKPLFWIVFTALSIGGVVYFAKNYHEAFPALSVDIKMNREMALDAAEELSKNIIGYQESIALQFPLMEIVICKPL